MSFRNAPWLLGWVLLLPPACGPDPEPASCGDVQDFDVKISAVGGDLPGDTVVVLIYGSGREEYRLSDAATHEVLFCTPTERDGQPLEAGSAGSAQGGTPADVVAGAAGASATAGAGGAGAAGGAGGASGVSILGVPALHCTLWTKGPATLEISAEGYVESKEELELRRGICTVEAEIELVRGDAGS